ncbi:glycosyltransferase family 39 protein [soil metagenome]
MTARAPILRSPIAWALLAWAALIVFGRLLIGHLNATGPDLLINAPPVAGRFDFVDPGIRILLPLAVIAAVVWFGPIAARRLGWTRMLICVALAGFAWAISLALLDPGSNLTGPPLRDSEYLHDLPLITSPGSFLSGFLDNFSTYATHVRGHPPGFILALWAMGRIGLGGALPAAFLMIGVGALAAPAALVGTREVVGEEKARAAAPFLVLMPAAIWIATSADALYAGVAAWAVALILIGTDRSRKNADAFALAGGFLMGVALMLSYGLLLITTIPLAVAFHRRNARPIALAAIAGLIPLLAFAAAGFIWTAGLLATRRTYYNGVADIRPYSAFVFTNLSAFAIVLGPAVAAGLVKLRGRLPWLLVGGGLAAMALADLSGMSKGEVERIWLPFAPWIALATCALPSGPVRTRLWLVAPALFALIFEVGVLTSW